MLSSLVLVSPVDDDEDLSRGPRVQRHSRLRFRRPATGVSGQASSSLSDSSEDEESRFSPVRGDLRPGEPSNEEKAEVVVDCSVGEEMEGEVERFRSVAEERRDKVEDESEEESDDEEASEEREPVEDSMSECASVYFTVLISSSNGVRNETRFETENNGLAGAIFRGNKCLAGLFARTDFRLCGCLYGIEMVTESVEVAEVRVEEGVEAEFGVEVLEWSPGALGCGRLAEMESFGLDGWPKAGAAEAGAS